jgi:hypothetical protein
MMLMMMMMTMTPNRARPDDVTPCSGGRPSPIDWTVARADDAVPVRDHFFFFEWVWRPPYRIFCFLLHFSCWHFDVYYVPTFLPHVMRPNTIFIIYVLLWGSTPRARMILAINQFS